MNVLLFRSALNAARAPFLLAAIAIAAAAILPISQAHADDYSDVNALVRAGKMSEALSRADQYLASKPRDPQMRFLKGVIQTEAGKPVEAIATFTQITQDYPELPEPYNNLVCCTLVKASLTKHVRPLKWPSEPTPATPQPMKTWAMSTPSWPARPTARHCSWTAATPACNPS